MDNDTADHLATETIGTDKLHPFQQLVTGEQKSYQDNIFTA
jgi:hypothetical protein